MSARARRLGDYVMTEAKQTRLKELAQQEADRDLATLNAQQAKASLLKADEKDELPLSIPELKRQDAEPPLLAAASSAPVDIPKRTRSRKVAVPSTI